MEKRIQITPEESNHIYNLFTMYTSYMNILNYLMENSKIQNVELYDKKWNEAVQINLQLDKAKREIEIKYKPLGEWQRFEFDFNNHQVVFMTNDK